MIEIIPAILPKNYEDLKNKIALVKGIVPLVQIDICDGLFVNNKSWPFNIEAENDLNFKRILNEQAGMPFWEEIEFELDLMTLDAISNLDLYSKLSPKRIVFHLEAIGNLEEFKNFLEGIDLYFRDVIEIGIAMNLNTSLEKVFPLVNSVDFVQFMGIKEIGFQGQDFDQQVLEKIKKLKEKYSDLILSVDGGVNLKTAPSLIQAGVCRLVAGSVIFNSEDIEETILKLKSMG